MHDTQTVCVGMYSYTKDQTHVVLGRMSKSLVCPPLAVLGWVERNIKRKLFGPNRHHTAWWILDGLSTTKGETYSTFSLILCGFVFSVLCQCRVLYWLKNSIELKRHPLHSFLTYFCMPSCWCKSMICSSNWSILLNVDILLFAVGCACGCVYVHVWCLITGLNMCSYG